MSTQEIITSLGTVDTIKNTYDKVKGTFKDDTITKDDNPNFGIVYQFADVAALLDIAEQLDIAKIIDKHVTKRKQGLSIGEYMVLAAINRAVQPVSKNTFYDWFNETVLQEYFPEGNKHSLSSQSFWNHMTEIDQDTISDIEDELASRIVETYGLSTDCLLFDNTNFITYIDTDNTAKIPQRGHSKEKRSDLKIIGLSLMATGDYNIPLFHDTYPGNIHDSVQFINIINQLKKRLSLLTDNQENVTLVFDKGNNSDKMVELLNNDVLQKLHFVGGLRLNQCPEVQSLKIKQYAPLIGESFGGTSAYRLSKLIYGKEFTLVITDNPKLRKEQLKGFNNNILKCKDKLRLLQNSLKLRAQGKITKGKRTLTSVAKNVKTILSPEHMKKVFSYNIFDSNNKIKLDYKFDRKKYNYLVKYTLGKTVLFTNRYDWSNEQIVSTYRSQFHVEETFKQLKNTKYVSFRPVRHFTDKTIRVHAFYCVIALTLASLLKLEMDKLGFKESINAILKDLNKSKQILTYSIKNNKNNTKVAKTFSKPSLMAKAIIEKRDLKKYSIK